jgi:hypothetical protein
MDIPPAKPDKSIPSMPPIMSKAVPLPPAEAPSTIPVSELVSTPDSCKQVLKSLFDVSAPQQPSTAEHIPVTSGAKAATKEAVLEQKSTSFEQEQLGSSLSVPVLKSAQLMTPHI